MGVRRVHPVQRPGEECHRLPGTPTFRGSSYAASSCRGRRHGRRFRAAPGGGERTPRRSPRGWCPAPLVLSALPGAAAQTSRHRRRGPRRLLRIQLAAGLGVHVRGRRLRWLRGDRGPSQKACGGGAQQPSRGSRHRAPRRGAAAAAPASPAGLARGFRGSRRHVRVGSCVQRHRTLGGRATRNCPRACGPSGCDRLLGLCRSCRSRSLRPEPSRRRGRRGGRGVLQPPQALGRSRQRRRAGREEAAALQCRPSCTGRRSGVLRQ
mmetsp:Transcript_100438/g.319014  ORF Transcript_100438/g.319014 Transcript_100438/m.319014 type:complete len:265 (+) Transcript_100438:594-1388(+)